MCRALTLLVRAANLHNSRAFAVFLGLASLAWRFADDWLCVVTGTALMGPKIGKEIFGEK